MLAEWRVRDPIARLEKHLRDLGWLDDSANAAIQERIRADVSAGVAEAEAARMPPPERALEGVFCGTCHEVPRVEPIWAVKETSAVRPRGNL
jgi:TPP-dependent pyruvate/acetoin dehydrogenase alpha subunit